VVLGASIPNLRLRRYQATYLNPASRSWKSSRHHVTPIILAVGSVQLNKATTSERIPARTAAPYPGGQTLLNWPVRTRAEIALPTS
jgi:hypothetical protein